MCVHYLNQNRNIFAIAYFTCKHIPTIYSQINIKRGIPMTDKKKLIGFSDAAEQQISSAARQLGLSFSAFTRSAAIEKASALIEAKAPAAD